MLILLLSFALVPAQNTQPFPSKQTALLVGGGIALVTALYFYNNYKNNHKDEKDYSAGNNAAKSTSLGVVSGTVCGGVLYLLLNSKSSKTDQASSNPSTPIPLPIPSGPEKILVKVDLNKLDMTKPTSGDMTKPTSGLVNLGNSCFMNAALQCELNSPQVRRALLRACSASGKATPVTETTALFAQLLHESLTMKTSSISPNMIHTFIRNKYFKDAIHTYPQHDLHEFLIMFMDQFDINNIYRGEKEEIMSCTQVGCNYQGKKKEPFLDIRVNFESTSRELLTMLQVQLGEEVVNGFKCDQCKKTGDIVKGVGIMKVPKRLLIQLVRNKSNLSKISDPVSFPLTANLLDNKTEYYLQGINVHIGKTINGGHYIAYVKDPVKDQWYKYDDSTRTNVSKAEIKKITETGKTPERDSTPYVLCYEQKIKHITFVD